MLGQEGSPCGGLGYGIAGLDVVSRMGPNAIDPFLPSSTRMLPLLLGVCDDGMEDGSDRTPSVIGGAKVLASEGASGCCVDPSNSISAGRSSSSGMTSIGP